MNLFVSVCSNVGATWLLLEMAFIIMLFAPSNLVVVVRIIRELLVVVLVRQKLLPVGVEL